MVIRSSSARQVDSLIARLRDGSVTEREAAIARLRVIGTRAMQQLITLATSTESPDVRVSALKALEGIQEPWARDTILEFLDDESADVACAAVAAARTWIASDTSVLDAMTSLVLDRARPSGARLAALDALAELPDTVTEPLLEYLATHDAALAARARERQVITLDQPADARDWIDRRGATAPLLEIHAAIVRMRDLERAERASRRVEEWQMARAAAHLALARRGSRVALYELRETFDGATPRLPQDFVNAAALIGDRGCLDSIARAWGRAARDPWWRGRLAHAARAIVARERLTPRHAVVKRARARYPGFLA